MTWEEEQALEWVDQGTLRIAKLMAEKKELLAALKVALGYMNPNSYRYDETRELVKAAIAKAEGR